MIVYSLRCANEHEFEAWFQDSAAFDSQAKRGVVVCPQCQSRKVEKAVMAPRVGKAVAVRGASGASGAAPDPAQAHALARDHALAEMLAKVRAHVEQNYDYVGERFPEEARRIHYGEAKERHIYGEATVGEAKELAEEGVPVAPLPPVPRRDS